MGSGADIDRSGAALSQSTGDSVELLETLTQADAVSGYEQEVREIFAARLCGVGELGYDRLGSVFCVRRGTSAEPRVLLDSHIDEVGFIVQRITSAGEVKFLPLGRWWAHALLAQRVRVLTRQGKVPGVIGSRPPHLLGPGEHDRVLDFADLFIDVGARSRGQAEAFGVVPGCPIAPYSPFLPLRDETLYTSKAFDNRVGVALVIETLERLDSHPNTVIGAGSAMEEVGLRGAGTVAEAVDPDVAIVLEGPYADDAPAAGGSTPQCRLGGGVHVRLYDPTMIANPGLCELVLDTARAHGIPHQVAVWGAGGTDAGAIHRTRRGVPSVVLGVPVRYIHSHVSVIDIHDYSATLELLRVLIPRLDRPLVRSLTGPARSHGGD
jgi:endoglucanase